LPIENQDGIWKISEICVNPGCSQHIEKVGLVGPKRNPRRIVSVTANIPKDLSYLSMVQEAVQPLIYQGEVASFWDNTQVKRGVNVDLKWQEADTILLLMSPELLARLYLYNWLERVSAALEQEGKEVIMLLLRPCSWKYAPVICDLKPLLEREAAVSTIGKDKAMEALVQALRRGVSI
jgi:hypothetical protein